MSAWHYQQNELFIEKLSVKDIAEKFGTPCYIYSKAALAENWRTFAQAFSRISHRICYAVKANSNLTLLHLLGKWGANFDIVSLGELERVMAAGCAANKIIFSGVGKKQNEIEAAIKTGIYCFNVESHAELLRIQTIAKKLKTTVKIALRVNPDVNPRTHSFISTGLKEIKFGIEIKDVILLCQQITKQPNLQLIGIACHIGSQIVTPGPFIETIDRMLMLYQSLQKMGILISHINIGGGLGIQYRDENPPTISEYANAVIEKCLSYPVEMMIEPGRAMVGNTGMLVTCVEYIKKTSHKNFAIVDAGMNDLLRPALYEAWQAILPVTLSNNGKKATYDIAGPLCESADFLGKERELAISEKDFLAVDSAGAYGFTMASNYNSRARPPEILVDGTEAHLIRRRETIQELFAAETLTSLI